GAHELIELVLEAAADLELDLDQPGVGLRAEEVEIDLGDALADLVRRQPEAPHGLAAVEQLGRLTVAVFDVGQRRAREAPLADAGRLGLAPLARYERREDERGPHAAPSNDTETVTSSSILNIRNLGALRPSCL